MLAALEQLAPEAALEGVQRAREFSWEAAARATLGLLEKAYLG
jgi:hypothetical protein